MTTESPRALVDLHGRSPWSILPALCLGFFMIMVDTTIVNIAIPTLQTSFDADLTSVGWVNSAYLLTFATLLLVTGRLGDRFGPRPVFIIGLVIFTLASLACGLSGTIGLLIAARAVQGIGAALMTPQTMSMITRVFPPQKRGAALGIWGAVAGVATIAGPVLGGILVESAGWEWIFYINIPVAVVALWFAVTRLPDAAHRQPLVRRPRRAAVGRRHVPARVRHPGGREVRLGHHHRSDHRLGRHRRRRRRARPGSSCGSATSRPTRSCR